MLKINNSCEIGDLMDEVGAKCDHTWGFIETAMFKCGIYPESTKTFLIRTDARKNGMVLVDKEGYEWLDTILHKIFDEAGIDEVYVTNEI